jgi:hypothetical protein
MATGHLGIKKMSAGAAGAILTIDNSAKISIGQKAEKCQNDF